MSAILWIARKQAGPRVYRRINACAGNVLIWPRKKHKTFTFRKIHRVTLKPLFEELGSGKGTAETRLSPAFSLS